MKTPFLTFVNRNNSTRTNNIFKLFIFVVVATLSLSSCTKKDTDENPQQQEEELPDGQALSQRFLENRQEALQTFTIDGSTGGIVTGEQGTKIIIPAGALGLNGSPVSGNIDIELIEIYTKEQMLLNNMPTNGERPNGNVEMIKSGGEFFINATQNGNQLEILSPIQLASKPIDFGDVDPEMALFKGGENMEDNDNWQEDEFTQVAMGEVQGTNGEWMANYLVDLSSFGWTNLDRWYNYNGTLTTLNIDTPEGYTGNTCEVYLSYDGEASGLARMDVYDEQTGMFTEHFGKIPVGQEVHIILVAEINGVLHYAIQGTTITQNHIEVMPEPQPGTEADLLNIIANLP